MLLFLKKKPEDNPGGADDGAQAAPDRSGFIPYYGHYNAHTLLTKNGELAQFIKITTDRRGLNYESGDDSANTVRDCIRRALREALPADRFAVWIHTIRKRRPIQLVPHEGEYFADYVQSRWQDVNGWRFQYYNEVYLSILHEGQSSALFDRKNLQKLIFPKTNRQWRNQFLDQSCQELDQATSGVLQKLREHYGAQRLALVERTLPDLPAPVFYSEPCEFLATLLNLRWSPVPLPDMDIGKSIVPEHLLFGFNALESKAAQGHRRFAAILTLKQYREMPADTIDRVLQAPIELVVSETFNFIPQAKALKQYKEQKQIFDISGDRYSVQASGLQDMLEGNHRLATDYGEHQISIMVLADEYKQIDQEVADAQAAFADLGLITIREDIKLEECFWSQLPGNFEFIRRKEPISTSRIAGLARLNRFPGGQSAGNHWGEAVAVVPTTVNSPYFFNFHHQDNGHTLFFNFNSFGDGHGGAMLDFLLTSALKYGGRMYVFDRGQSGRLWLDKLGGDYHIAGAAGRRAMALNPFSLEDNKRNRSFLLAWCQALLEPATQVGDGERGVLRGAIDTLYALPAPERSLAKLIELTAAHDASLARALLPYAQGGLLAAAHDAFDTRRKLHGFDLDALHGRPQWLLGAFAYLMHRIIDALDGTPTVIVLREAWELLENAFFAPRLESLLEMLKQNNVMLVCATDTPQNVADTHSLAALMQHCATTLYAPDDLALNYAALGLGLSEHDSRLLRRMDRQKGHLLLKQNHESIGLRIDLSEMDDVRAIFCNDVKNLIAAGGRFAAAPKD